MRMVTVLLAAGESSRMGEPKLLLPHEGKPLFLAALEPALAASEQVVLVTGWYHEQIVRAVEPYLLAYPERLVIARNGEPARGQFSSTLLGVRKIPPGTDFCIAMADAPLITERHYRTLIDLLGTCEAVRPFCDGIPGHPVLCAATLRQEILRQPSESSMRQFLSDRDVRRHDTDDPAWITDIDTPMAYQQLLRRAHPCVPSGSDDLHRT